MFSETIGSTHVSYSKESFDFQELNVIDFLLNCYDHPLIMFSSLLTYVSNFCFEVIDLYDFQAWKTLVEFSMLNFSFLVFSFGIATEKSFGDLQSLKLLKGRFHC